MYWCFAIIRFVPFVLTPPTSDLTVHSTCALSCIFQIIDIGQFWILYQCIPKMPPTSPWLTKVAIEKKITDFVQSKLDPKEGTEAWSTIARMSPGYRVGSRSCHHATWKHGICLEWRGGVCFLLKAILTFMMNSWCYCCLMCQTCFCELVSLMGGIVLNDDNVTDELNVSFLHQTYRTHIYVHVGLRLVSQASSTNWKLSNSNIGFIV